MSCLCGHFCLKQSFPETGSQPTCRPRSIACHWVPISGIQACLSFAMKKKQKQISKQKTTSEPATYKLKMSSYPNNNPVTKNTNLNKLTTVTFFFCMDLAFLTPGVSFPRTKTNIIRLRHPRCILGCDWFTDTMRHFRVRTGSARPLSAAYKK